MEEFLSGKKTYMMGGLIVFAAIAYNQDWISPKEWEGILTALAGATAMTLRAALAKNGK